MGLTQHGGVPGQIFGGDASKRRFAAIVPVGPTIADVARAVALLSSLTRWEPELGWCIVADNSMDPRGLSELAFIPASCRAVTLTNTRKGSGRSWSGGLTARILHALAWAQANTTAEFILRIDTDALVIAPFAEAIRAFLVQRPDAGIIGTVGLSCNPKIRALEDLTQESKLLRAHRLLPTRLFADGQPSEPFDVDGVGRFSINQLSAFDRVRGHVQTAADKGYTSSEFCQGGAYVVTRSMLDRMAATGYLEQPDVWIELPFSEDRVTAMYARAVGLHICDYSSPGQPFGMNFMGLPYSPAELVARGYSVIHSVRNDRRFSEDAIRQFFNSQS